MSTPASTTALCVPRGALRRQRGRRWSPRRRAISSIRAADQLLLDRLGVHLLQPPGGGLLVAARRPRRAAARGSSYRVHSPSRSSTPSPPSRPISIAVCRRHHAVHRAGHQRQLEPVGVDLPGDRDLLRVPGPAGGHDADLVQRVGPAPRLAPADLDVSHVLRFSARHRAACSSAPRPSSGCRAGGSPSGPAAVIRTNRACCSSAMVRAPQ